MVVAQANVPFLPVVIQLAQTTTQVAALRMVVVMRIAVLLVFGLVGIIVVILGIVQVFLQTQHFVRELVLV